MKAVHIKQFGISHLELVDLPTPEPRPGEVRVNITAVALQFLDLGIVKGDIMPDLPLPHIPGSEGAGIVDATGQGVTKWKKGDRVMLHFVRDWIAGKSDPSTNAIRMGLQTQGVLAQYTCVPEHALVPSPESLTDAEAATLPVTALTAWVNLVRLAGLKAGQTVLTQGTGGVSLAAMQFAKAFGARVIATSGSSEKLKKLKGLGADDVINYNEHPEWYKEVARLTDHKGVDITLDVGGNKTLSNSIRSCTMGAYVGLVGFLSGADVSIKLSDVIMQYVRLQGNSVGNREDFEDMVRAVTINNIKPVIDSVYAMAAVREAFERMEGQQQFGRVIVETGATKPQH